MKCSNGSHWQTAMKISPSVLFHWIGPPLGHQMYFLRGLSLALRAHDQFPGLSLVLPPSTTWKPGNLETWKCVNWDTRKLGILFVHLVISATVRIGPEIQCLPYAVFFYFEPKINLFKIYNMKTKVMSRDNSKSRVRICRQKPNNTPCGGPSRWA